METQKKFLYFPKGKFFLIYSRNGNPEKLFIFQEKEALKNFAYCRKSIFRTLA